MGKLPSYRVCPTPPFQKVSVDLVGHFLVKPTMTSRKQSKVWVLMYLCDVSKALHTEVIDPMSSSFFFYILIFIYIRCAYNKILITINVWAGKHINNCLEFLLVKF